MRLIFVTKEIIGRNIWQPIIDESQKRGYDTVLTDDPSIFGDIGFYCDDRSVPGNQLLSVITINGLDQDHVIRPNYSPWFREENWGLFDVGLLPGDRWGNGWVSSETSISANPRYGVYKVGWPKSDYMFLKADPAEERLKHGHKRRVLYAPQTEQDGKQTQVVQALRNINVNLRIKHWETPEESIFYRHLLTENYFKNLHNENKIAKKEPWIEILNPKSNFIEALFHADLLITDQSSVIYEAALGGIPTVSVNGWRHACNPCLGPQPSPDICLSSDLSDLPKNINLIFSNYEEWVKKSISIRDDNFTNLGVSSKVILDLLINKQYISFHKQRLMKSLPNNFTRRLLCSSIMLYLRRKKEKYSPKRLKNAMKKIVRKVLQRKVK